LHAQAFVATYSAEDVTTYMHILVYHYGEFLKKYSSIEKFTNYALKSKHSTMKRILADCTSSFTRGPAAVAQQQLHALVHLEKHEERKRKREEEELAAAAPLVAPPPPPTRTRKPHDWASVSLATHPEITHYVGSSTIT
jgi:hypothetical protein